MTFPNLHFHQIYIFEFQHLSISHYHRRNDAPTGDPIADGSSDTEEIGSLYEYDLSGVFDEPIEGNHAVAVLPTEVVFLEENPEKSDEKQNNTVSPIADVGIDREEIGPLQEYDSSGVFDGTNGSNQPGVVLLEEKPGKSDESQKLSSFEMEDVATSLDGMAGYYSEDSDVVEVTAYYLDYESE